MHRINLLYLFNLAEPKNVKILGIKQAPSAIPSRNNPSTKEKASGFPPVEYTNTMEKNDIKNRIDKSISKKKTTLTTHYYRAYRTGDASGMAEEIIKLIPKEFK